MTDTIITLAITTALFFLFTTLYVLRNNKKEYKCRLEGARALVKRTKKLRSKRESLFQESDALKSIEDTKFESLWLAELEFYQSIAETLCEPTESTIKKVTSHVTKLLTPYYEVMDDISRQIVELPSTTIEHTPEQPIDQNDFATLEKRYQQKIEENAKLQKQIDIFKKSPHTKDIKNIEPQDDSFIALINHLLSKISQLANIEHEEIKTFDIAQIEEKYQKIEIILSEKLNQPNVNDDESDQSEALIEQLRNEKVENLKKYKRAMLLLFNTYQEYASAFGLDAPQDQNLEIDEFEKFIEDN